VLFKIHKKEFYLKKIYVIILQNINLKIKNKFTMTKLNEKKILVIGSGGREHGICEAFKNSSQPTQIFALPGNAGTKNIAENVKNVNISDFQAIINFCEENKIDFVFIGPEQPLVEGLVEILENHKIRVFGPSKKASQLEGSKIFMKKIADDNQVPTAQYQTFEETKPALEFVKKIGFPCVIKADGLASGKGVIIAQNFEEAKSSVEEILSGKFGDAGKKIIIEEFLKGFEVSYFVICDGKNFLPLGFAHDHKKVGENETGLNTGGMGTFSPSPFVTPQIEEIILNVKSQNHLICIVSTVMPGTCDYLISDFIPSKLKSALTNFQIAYSPEFVALGTVIDNMQTPDMILIGANDVLAVKILEPILKSIVINNPEMRIA
jgi:hypothetical protein